MEAAVPKPTLQFHPGAEARGDLHLEVMHSFYDGYWPQPAR